MFIDNCNSHFYVLHIYVFLEHCWLNRFCSKHHTDIQENPHGLLQYDNKCSFLLLKFYSNHDIATLHWHSCSSWKILQTPDLNTIMYRIHKIQLKFTFCIIDDQLPNVQEHFSLRKQSFHTIHIAMHCCLFQQP